MIMKYLGGIMKSFVRVAYQGELVGRGLEVGKALYMHYLTPLMCKTSTRLQAV